MFDTCNILGSLYQKTWSRSLTDYGRHFYIVSELMFHAECSRLSTNIEVRIPQALSFADFVCACLTAFNMQMKPMRGFRHSAHLGRFRRKLVLHLSQHSLQGHFHRLRIPAERLPLFSLINIFLCTASRTRFFYLRLSLIFCVNPANLRLRCNTVKLKINSTIC